MGNWPATVAAHCCQIAAIMEAANGPVVGGKWGQRGVMTVRQERAAERIFGFRHPVPILRPKKEVSTCAAVVVPYGLRAAR